MTPTQRLYHLKSDKDYRPGHGVIDATHPCIKSLHCIQFPEKPVNFKTILGQKISLPPEAFVAGAIYPYQIVQINDEGARCFVGLSY